ncbi:MAG: OmpH family outer membrane protein [Mangrovibacterium sp.]
MKNNLIFNSILSVAVVVLFILHFTCKSASTGSQHHANLSEEITIAYVNTDSILLNYELSRVLHEELTTSQSSYTDEYAKKRTAWESKATKFQEKVQRGGFLTEERAIQERDQLASEQEELMSLDQELSNKLAEMQSKNTTQLIDSIMSAIKRYNMDQKYSYIFSANSILVGHDASNITADILKMMNEEYNSTKK